MNRTIFWRLFWKEYRLQRALWIAMAVLTALLVGITFIVVDPPEKIPWMFWIALAFSAIYPLGCGATLFAGEHEAGAYEFQRTLPVEASQVFLAKMLLALVSAAALSGLMWLLVALLSHWNIPEPAQGRLPAMIGGLSLLAFLWAAFFSMLLKHALTAAVLGGTATFISAAMAIGMMALRPDNEPDVMLVSVSFRVAAIAALVALLNYRLGARWFRENRRDRPRHSLLTCPDPGSATMLRVVVGRLVWQQWKQDRWILGFLLAVQFFPFPMFFTHTWDLTPSLFAGWSSYTLAMCLTASILGVYTFHADQRGSSFRFLADRGAPPRYIWLSRQAIVLLPVALYAIVRVSLALAPALHTWPSFMRIGYIVAYLFVTPLALGVCVGQLFSMFVRSAILGVLFSVLLTAVLTGWCGLMQAWHVELLWSMLPIPVALLWATWLRTPYWLVERNDWRAWLPSGLMLAVPTLVILTCVACHRAHEIPLVDPGFSPEEFDRPMTSDERKTHDLYQQAIQKLVPRKIEGNLQADDALENRAKLTDGDIAWVKANEATIALAIQASRGKLRPAEVTPFEQMGLLKLGRLLVDHAVVLEGQGKLDAALDDYRTAIRISLHLRDLNLADPAGRVEMSVYARLSAWATHSGQTPARIIAAVRELQQLTSHVSVINGIKLAYLQTWRAIQGDAAAIRAEDFPSPQFTTLWLRLPWERERAMRLLNARTHAQLASLSQMETDVRKGEWPFSSLLRSDSLGLPQSAYIYYMPHNWLGTVVAGVPNPYDSDQRDHMLKRDYAIQETSRRAIQLILALEAWKLQHGSLPKTLDELVGPCLDRLPVDPCSGEPFCYFREGIPGRLPPAKFEWPYVHVATSSPDMPPHSPFFWSIGLDIQRVSHSGDILGQYELLSGFDGFVQKRTGQARVWELPNSTYALWINGWPFPIP